MFDFYLHVHRMYRNKMELKFNSFFLLMGAVRYRLAMGRSSWSGTQQDIHNPLDVVCVVCVFLSQVNSFSQSCLHV